MSRLPFVLAVLVIPAAALAQGLPSWDVQTYCKKRAQKSGMTSNELVDSSGPHYADLQACIVAAEAFQHTTLK